MRFPFSKTPVSESFLHYHGDGQVTQEHVFDREPILRHAAEMRATPQRGSLRKIMTIPQPLLWKWVQEGKLGEASYVNGSPVVDQATAERLMRDPDYAALRCVDKL